MPGSHAGLHDHQGQRWRSSSMNTRSALLFFGLALLFSLSAEAASSASPSLHALLMTVEAQAAPSSVPNDCWSGVMAADKAAHGRLVATGPVTQWRIGAPLVVYSTVEDYAQIEALANQGKTGTFDTAHPITVIPTWISGPEPGDKDNPDEAKNIEVALKYRTPQGETGNMLLTYWTPMAGKDASIPPDQQAAIIQQDWLLHDMSCRGIP